MRNILILGASGQIAQWVVKTLADESDVHQTLLLRDSKKLSGREPASSKVVIGNVLDKKLLQHALVGQDVVYANLTGKASHSKVP